MHCIRANQLISSTQNKEGEEKRGKKRGKKRETPRPQKGSLYRYVSTLSRESVEDHRDIYWQRGKRVSAASVHEAVKEKRKERGGHLRTAEEVTSSSRCREGKVLPALSLCIC
jgi:hypothetical protein